MLRKEVRNVLINLRIKVKHLVKMVVSTGESVIIHRETGPAL